MCPLKGPPRRAQTKKIPKAQNPQDGQKKARPKADNSKVANARYFKISPASSENLNSLSRPLDKSLSFATPL